MPDGRRSPVITTMMVTRTALLRQLQNVKAHHVQPRLMGINIMQVIRPIVMILMPMPIPDRRTVLEQIEAMEAGIITVTGRVATVTLQTHTSMDGVRMVMPEQMTQDVMEKYGNVATALSHSTDVAN